MNRTTSVDDLILYLDFHYSDVSSQIIDNVLACSNKFSQYLSIPAIVGEIVKLVKVDHLDHMESFKGDTTFFLIFQILINFLQICIMLHLWETISTFFYFFKNLKTFFFIPHLELSVSFVQKYWN